MRDAVRPLSRLTIVAALVNLCGQPAQAAPQTAIFDKAVATHTWPLAAFDPNLPPDWSAYRFLIVEFRASSSQRFELGLTMDGGVISKRIHPYANVWVRASIPLRYFREGLGDAGDLAATVNQPRNGYWINIEAGGHGPTVGVRALSATMRYPAKASILKIRSVRLSMTDPGDAILGGATPIIDALGQYIHDSWPEKAKSLQQLKAEWRREDLALQSTRAANLCKFGGYSRGRLRATGFFRVEKVGDRWWFVDPEGCRFYSNGVNGAGGLASRTRTTGREAFFAQLPTMPFLPATLTPPVNLAPDQISFHTVNLQRRYGEDWYRQNARTVSRRMTAWGLNTAYGPGLNDALDPNSRLKQPYVFTMRGWQMGEGSIMGMPDVYSEAFASRVDADVQRQLAPRKDDPWMIGYFIGNEPPWPGRENQLVDLVLAGPNSAIQARFRSELAKGDNPTNRKAMVLAAFERYLAIVNAAVKRHDKNHLNLGIRFGGTPPDDVIALARGFDVYSMNKYRWTPPRDFLDRVYALVQLPILVGEFHIGTPGRGLAPGLVQAATQEERGVAYRYYVENAAEHPSVIGTHWFQWADQPATGRSDGENYNIGWVDVTDRPYTPLVRAGTQTHARLDAIHSGRERPTARKPKASTFGTPEDAMHLGIPAIQ